MDEVRIFISYAREDETRVKLLYQQLADAGFQPWLDREHIIPGMKWEPVIKKALKQSDFVLVCLSANSINKRGFLQREIKQALEQAEEKLEHDVYLIPARLDDCEVPDALSEIQWVDLFEDDGWPLLLKAIEYGLKQRGKTMPKPFSYAARTETAAPLPLPSDSSPKKIPADLRLVTVTLPEPKLYSDEHVTVINFGEGIQGKSVEQWRAAAGHTAKDPRLVSTHQSFTENLNGVPLEIIFVPGGAFKMGSPEAIDYYYERPSHDVTVSGFYIGKYPITQAQWKAAMGNNPSYFKGDLALPVEHVSWNDAKQFCEKLSKITGKKYRLPSEAEWEYSCRAGTVEDYAGDLDAMAWYRDNSGSRIHPVGQKQPNAFGLYDMHGNIWEWCEDVWHDNYYGAPTDGSAWLSGGDSTNRVVRGGSWYYDGVGCRSAYRGFNPPIARISIIGFRIVVAA
jgi:formylglycine-generating enzyme required for sulfatase activity